MTPVNPNDERVQVLLLRDDFGGYRDRWGTQGGSTTGSEREAPVEDELGGGANFVPNVRLPQNPMITAAGLTIAAGIAVYSATLVR
jgi:hypothetical protein